MHNAAWSRLHVLTNGTTKLLHRLALGRGTARLHQALLNMFKLGLRQEIASVARPERNLVVYDEEDTAARIDYVRMSS